MTVQTPSTLLFPTFASPSKHGRSPPTRSAPCTCPLNTRSTPASNSGVSIVACREIGVTERVAQVAQVGSKVQVYYYFSACLPAAADRCCGERCWSCSRAGGSLRRAAEWSAGGAERRRQQREKGGRHSCVRHTQGVSERSTALMSARSQSYCGDPLLYRSPKPETMVNCGERRRERRLGLRVQQRLRPAPLGTDVDRSNVDRVVVALRAVDARHAEARVVGLHDRQVNVGLDLVVAGEGVGGEIWGGEGLVGI